MRIFVPYSLLPTPCSLFRDPLFRDPLFPLPFAIAMRSGLIFSSQY
ncbi:hypothetical protein [Moorena producens]|nr:hypothetical protein [Moorena producens]